jgi:hypothetical protein
LPVVFAAREPALSMIPPAASAPAPAPALAGTQVVLDISSAAASEILAAIVASGGASSASVAGDPAANTVALATPVGVSVSIQGGPLPGSSAGAANAATIGSTTPTGGGTQQTMSSLPVNPVASPAASATTPDAAAADPGEQGPTTSPETPQPAVPDGSHVVAENLGPGQAQAGAEPLPGGLQVIASILGDNPSPGIGAGVSRRWAAMSDWLDDLVRAEAADAAELGRRLAAGALVAGACMALGNHVYTARSRRNSEKTPDPTIAS